MPSVEIFCNLPQTVTYKQVTPELTVLHRHPEPPPLLQTDERLLREPGTVLLQETPLEVSQDAVHVNQNPQPLTRGGGGGGHVYANPLKRITMKTLPSSE